MANEKPLSPAEYERLVAFLQWIMQEAVRRRRLNWA